MDFASGLRVGRLTLSPWRLELLLTGPDLHHHLAGDVGRALAENLADLAHGRELFGFARRLVAILGANAALGTLGWGLVGRFLAAPRSEERRVGKECRS